MTCLKSLISDYALSIVNHCYVDETETQAIVDQWMTNVQIRRSKENSKQGEMKDTSIPVTLPPVNDLPPSLKPVLLGLTNDSPLVQLIDWG